MRETRASDPRFLAGFPSVIPYLYRKEGIMSYTKQYLSEAAQIIAQLDTDTVDKMVDLLVHTREEGGRLFILGVGGGAGASSCIRLANSSPVRWASSWNISSTCFLAFAFKFRFLLLDKYSNFSQQSMIFCSPCLWRQVNQAQRSLQMLEYHLHVLSLISLRKCLTSLRSLDL